MPIFVYKSKQRTLAKFVFGIDMHFELKMLLPVFPQPLNFRNLLFEYSKFKIYILSTRILMIIYSFFGTVCEFQTKVRIDSLLEINYF